MKLSCFGKQFEIAFNFIMPMPEPLTKKCDKKTKKQKKNQNEISWIVFFLLKKVTRTN